MKRMIITLTAVLFLLITAACGSAPAPSAQDTDLDYIRNKGTLIVGITDFAPMDYMEGGEWIGFDADLAKEAADKVLYMDQGEIVEYGNARTVIDTPSKERTKAFLERYY